MGDHAEMPRLFPASSIFMRQRGSPGSGACLGQSRAGGSLLPAGSEIPRNGSGWAGLAGSSRRHPAPGTALGRHPSTVDQQACRNLSKRRVGTTACGPESGAALRDPCAANGRGVAAEVVACLRCRSEIRALPSVVDERPWCSFLEYVLSKNAQRPAKRQRALP